jgi:hypothetical protein
VIDLKKVQAAKARVAHMQEFVSNPDSQMGGDLDRGPVEYARIKAEKVAQTRKDIASLTEAIEAAEAKYERQVREAAEASIAKREEAKPVCTSCWMIHSGDCL